MKYAPGRMASKKFASIRPRVCAFAATCTLTISDARATSMGDAWCAMPSSPAASAVKLRLHATTGMPKPLARGIISRPIRPTPIRPKVRPSSPRAFENSALFHCACRSATTLSAMRRSSANISAKANSATATEFFPGQFET